MSERKGKIAYRVKTFLSEASRYVADGEFWSDFPEKDLLQTAWAADALTIPAVPIAGNFLDYHETFDASGDINSYKYVIRDPSSKMMLRYETADDETDRDHVHTYRVPGEHQTAERRPRERPEIPELFARAAKELPPA